MTATTATTAAQVQELVAEGGEHQPSWSFSGCACGWQAEWPSDVRRMPQYLAHILDELLVQVGWMMTPDLAAEFDITPTSDEYLITLEQAEQGGGIKDEFQSRVIPIYRPSLDELLVTMPKACPYCRAMPDCTPTCITRLTQTPHDTEAPGGGRPTFGHASVRRNGHDGDAGRSAASLAETAAPNVCIDDVCRSQGSCAWDCRGRKYVP